MLVRILRVTDPLPLAVVPGPGGAQWLCRELVAALGERGIDVDEIAVSLDGFSDDVMGHAFETAARIARHVGKARHEGRLVVVLAGGCLTALGSCSGLLSERRAVLWLDAHGDFNTPETTVSGMVDGMALAALTGRCWTRPAGRIPGFRPIPESAVTLVGARDLDPAESVALGSSAIRRPARGAGTAEVLADLALPGAELYVHLDADVLDASVGRANRLASGGGLTAEALRELLGAVGRTGHVGVVAVTAYDPVVDSTGAAGRAAIGAVCALLENAATAVAEHGP